MENKSTEIVEVTCYGRTKTYTRNQAIQKFLEAMMCCEGAERERYTRIFCALSAGFTKVTDEEEW